MAQRPRRRARFVVRGLGLAALIGVVAVLAVAVAWLRSDDFRRRASGLVERVVEDQTGEQLTLGSIRVHLWPPAVELDGLHLFDRDSGETIVSAEHVRAPLVLRRGGVGLGQLHVVHPVVQLHVGDDGKLLSLDRMKSGGEPLRELPWSSLRVEDGTFRLVFPDGEVEIAHFEAVPEDGPITDLSGRLRFRYAELEQAAAFRLDNTTLGPDRIAVPELRLELPLATIELYGEVPLGGAIDARLKGSLRLAGLNPLLTPNALHGQVDFDVGVSGAADDPKVEAALLAVDVSFEGPAEDGTLVVHRFGDASAGVQLDRTGLVVEKAVIPWGEGRITVWGRVDPDLRVTDGHVIAEQQSLAWILRSQDAFRTPWVDFVGDVDAAVTGTLDPLRLTGPFEVALMDFIVRDGPVDDPRNTAILAIPYASVEGELELLSDRITLFGHRLRTPKSRGSATAVLGFEPGPFDIRAELDPVDLSDLRPLNGAELEGVGRVTARIWGHPGTLAAEGHADVANFSATGIPYADRITSPVRSPRLESIELTDAVAVKGDTHYGGRFTMSFLPETAIDTDIDVHTGRVEDLVGMFVDLDGITGDIAGSLWLRGPLYDMDGEADVTVADVSLYGERFPRGEAHGYMDGGLFTLDDLRLLRGDGGEGVILRGSVGRQYALNMEAVGDGLLLEHSDWLAPAGLPIAGRASFVARIDNTLFEPEPHGRIFVSDVRYAGRPVADSIVRFETTDGVLAWRADLVGDTVASEGTIGLWDEQPYALRARFERFPAHLLWPVAADGGPIEAILTGGLELHGHFGDAPSPVDIVADATDVTVRWSGHTLKNTSPWRYEQHGTAFELEQFGLAGGQTRLQLTATGGDQPLLVAGGGDFDLDLLRAVVPGLVRSEGIAQVNVFASGGGADLRAQVDVTLENGVAMRHASFPGTFEDVTARIVGTRDGYRLVEGRAGLGGGTIDASGSRIEADGWLPVRFDLAAEADDVQLQWVDYLPPARGRATIACKGPVDALLLDGRVDIDEMTFSDRIDWQDWVVEWRDELLVEAPPEDEIPWFSLDLRLVADQSIRLRNNVAEGVASANLRVIGDTSRPGLVGTVSVDEAVLYLQDRKFRVDRGLLAFRDPWTWDPDLDFDLVTEIESRERRYRVNYYVLGPFSSWRTESRSDPPLPQADVNALLWFGVTAEDLEEMGELPQAIGQGVADLVLADIFTTSQAANDLRQELGVFADRIDFVTGVNARGDYSSDPRLRVEKDFGATQTSLELNLYQPDDVYARWDVPVGDSWSLAAWYASRQRDRVLSIGGAYGVDLTARWDVD